MDIKELEKVDFDIMENVKVALRELWKKKMIIILVTILGALEALVYVGIVGNDTFYTSSAEIFSGAYGSSDEASYSGVSAMNVYSGLIGSTRVCERAASQLEEYGITADTLKNMVLSGNINVVGASSSSREYGYKLTITVISHSQEQVVSITNAMANAFASEVNELIGESSVQVMDEAREYGSYQAINLKLYIILFSAVGLVLVSILIFCIGFFSRNVKSVEQCELNDTLVLGILPYERK